jgi:hypothetical protein
MISTRPCLKTLYAKKDELHQKIQSLTEDYIKELDGKCGIYITEHAMVRYLERVRNFTIVKGATDIETLYLTCKTHDIHSLPMLRKEILTDSECLEILRRQKSFYQVNRGFKYTLVIKELAVVTIKI